MREIVLTEEAVMKRETEIVQEYADVSLTHARYTLSVYLVTCTEALSL